MTEYKCVRCGSIEPASNMEYIKDDWLDELFAICPECGGETIKYNKDEEERRISKMGQYYCDCCNSILNDSEVYGIRNDTLNESYTCCKYCGSECSDYDEDEEYNEEYEYEEDEEEEEDYA